MEAELRKILFFMLTTLDGYFEGPERDITWHNVDAEFNEFAIEQLNSVDALLFGRATYELMAAYWPTESARTDDPLVSARMNQTPKLIFSKTLSKVGWENTRLIKDNFVEEVRNLKAQPGRDMAIFGSSDLAVTFIPHGLIDEFRIMVNPVVLGSGKPLFKGIHNKLNLHLTRSKVFASGNVLLYYEPASR